MTPLSGQIVRGPEGFLTHAAEAELVAERDRLAGALALLKGSYGQAMLLRDEAITERNRLRAAIEDYRLWRPGEKGHAEAHRKLMEALDG